MTLGPKQLSFLEKHYFSSLYQCPSKYLNTDHDLIILKDQTNYNWFIALIMYYPIIRFSKRLSDDCSLRNFLWLLACMCFVWVCNVIIYLEVILISPSVLLFLAILLVSAFALCICISIGLGVLLICSLFLDQRHTEEEKEQIKPVVEMSFDEWIVANNISNDKPCDSICWITIVVPLLVFNGMSIIFLHIFLQ